MVYPCPESCSGPRWDLRPWAGPVHSLKFDFPHKMKVESCDYEQQAGPFKSPGLSWEAPVGLLLTHVDLPDLRNSDILGQKAGSVSCSD